MWDHNYGFYDSYFSKEFNYNLIRSVFVLFSMNSRRLRIQPGYSIANIFSYNTCTQMINNIVADMRNSDHYNAMNKLIEDIDYYYNKKKPSAVIWEKIINVSESGEMIIPENKRHFIYDEQNYLKEESNNKKMQALYEKQENVYVKNGIANYIFLVDYINEFEEDLEDCAKSFIIVGPLRFHYYKYSMRIYFL